MGGGFHDILEYLLGDSNDTTGALFFPVSDSPFSVFGRVMITGFGRVILMILIVKASSLSSLNPSSKVYTIV